MPRITHHIHQSGCFGLCFNLDFLPALLDLFASVGLPSRFGLLGKLFPRGCDYHVIELEGLEAETSWACTTQHITKLSEVCYLKARSQALALQKTLDLWIQYWILASRHGPVLMGFTTVCS